MWSMANVSISVISPGWSYWGDRLEDRMTGTLVMFRLYCFLPFLPWRSILEEILRWVSSILKHSRVVFPERLCLCQTVETCCGDPLGYAVMRRWLHCSFRKFRDLGGVWALDPHRSVATTTTTTCQWLSKPTCAGGDELASACALETACVSVCRSGLQMLEQISCSMESERHRRLPHTLQTHTHVCCGSSSGLSWARVRWSWSQECFEIYT